MKKRHYRRPHYYRLECRYHGQNDGLDRHLTEIIGRRADAVGYDYERKERNLNWLFRNEEEAHMMRKRVAAALGTHVRCILDADRDKIDCHIRVPRQPRKRHRG